MLLAELEIVVDEMLPTGYSIETDKYGQVVIYTGLRVDDEEELVPLETEEDETIDPNFDRLDDEDEVASYDND